jgi:GT2 family glycosyltransferase
VKILTIIVTFNAERWIEKCLNSLINSSIKPYIYIIDNNSTDNTLNIISNYKLDSIIVYKNNQNKGFGYANNIGIKYAVNNNMEYVFLLNQDAWISNDTLSILINKMDKYPNYGILAPIQYNANYILDKQFLIYIQKPILIEQNIIQVKFVNAAAWLIKKECFSQVGYFSKIFFQYGEDVDYCNRVRFHCYKIGITKDTFFIHDRSVRISTRKQLGKQIYFNQIANLLNINYSFISSFFLQFIFILKNHRNNSFFLALGRTMMTYKSIFKIYKERRLNKYVQ